MIRSLLVCMCKCLCHEGEAEEEVSSSLAPLYYQPRRTWVRNPLTSGYALEKGRIGQALIQSGIISRRENWNSYGTNPVRTSEFLYLSGGSKDILSREGKKAMKIMQNLVKPPEQCYEGAHGQLERLPTETFVEQIMPYLHPRDVAKFARVSRSAHRIVASYVNLNKNVNYRLAKISIAETQLTAIMRQSATWAAIVGDFPLQVFLGERYPLTELRVYCGHDVQVPFQHYLLQQGYTYKEKRNQRGHHANWMIRVCASGHISVRFPSQTKRGKLRQLNKIVAERPTHLQCKIILHTNTSTNTDANTDNHDVTESILAQSNHPDETKLRKYRRRAGYRNDEYAAYGFHVE